MGKTYKDAGVDIDANDAFVSAIRGAVQSTHGPDVLKSRNNFAGQMALLAGGQARASRRSLFSRQFRDPVLVACTDGVGTKLKIAFATGRHETVGIDLVAMSVNDLVTTGAEPLFFLDYLAFSGVSNEVQVDLVKGIAHACRESGCALLGGERAELPGFYKDGEYDLAGFAVGVVERRRRITGRKIRPGDAVVGIASSGLHSNGYSLARQVLLEDAGLRLDEHVAELGRTLGEELLEPTALYAAAITAVVRHYKVKAGLRGVANITGGGIPENLPRILPRNCAARLRRSAWQRQPIFDLIQRLGDVEDREMYRVFNMGIGMILVVPPTYADAIIRRIRRHGHEAAVVGEIVRGERTVMFVD
jgi:phosphoribosylformylglycinamidine cyclo-ligase